MAPAETPRHQSGGLAVALAKLNLDALTVADAVADVAAMAGENVTTAIRADLKELRAETNARFAETNGRIDTLTGEMNARFAETNARIGETNARIGETHARIGEANARINTVAGSILSLQREMSTLRWMIGIGFTSLGALLAILTFFRAGTG